MNYELERLEIRLGFIQQRMSNIRSSGKIAAPRTWIQKYVVPKKNGKKYYYYRLMEATNKRSPSGAIQGKLKLYLGGASNRLYRIYKEAIARRNELQLLQRRYNKLMALYRKALCQTVSVGEEESLREGVEAPQNPLVPLELVRVIEDIQQIIGDIQESHLQLWHWLKVIGERLGITVTQGYEVTG